MSNAPLRGCPTCGTRVEDVDMGLRDYRWVSKYLPGRVAPSDLDSILETGGSFLVMEYKPEGVALTMGQRILLKGLVRKDFDVLVVWGTGPVVEVGQMDRNGNVDEVRQMTVDELGEMTGRWFHAHNVRGVSGA